MFTVPADPDNPSYDRTFTVSFWQWLTSSKADRQEWRRRRDAVGQARVARADARVEQATAARDQAKQHKRAQRQARKH